MTTYYNSYIPDITKKLKFYELIQINMDPNCCNLLLNNPDLIDWNIIKYNYNNYIIYYNYPEKITWDVLEYNPNLFEIIRTDLNLINWKV